ncbi:MAG: Rrf2 family transcriptional regulator [Gemmatimonadota bacterium]|nr:MAG: Rrf2 family transcriptional regulator [Gemmatimonadota bacterium]
MKIGTRARYTLRFMIALGRLSSKGEPVGLGEVSRSSGISRRYLDHLVVPLKSASLIRAKAGRAGGYVLARPADDIRLGDIIEAAIGPIAVTECAVDPEACIAAEFCDCRELWMLINRRITAVLNDYTLADMLSETWLARVQHELRKADHEPELARI